MDNEWAIEAHGLSKEYRLGVTNHGVLYRDLQSWWARIHGRPDPNAPIREAGLQSEGRDGAASFLALDEVSFRVPTGSTFGVIGKNGAGKSTLLKILSRITTPTSGTARLRGRVASLLEVGTGFHPELTGRDNIYLNGAILGMKRAETRKKFDEIVAFAQLARFVDTPVKRYSSGMYVRLAFAVAAHLQAEILIVDEVLAVGDYEFQRRCLAKMREVASDGRTVLLVSHNMSAVQNLCKAAMLIDRGRIVVQGSSAEVIQAYTRNQEGQSAGPALVSRTDRGGTGAFRFVDAAVRVAASEVHALIATGAPVSIDVVIEASSGASLSEVDVAIGIDNYLGERITIISTQMAGMTLREVRPGRTTVSFSLDRMPLVPGRYSFTLSGAVKGVVADWVQAVGWFTVEPGDFYGKRGPLFPGQGSILVPYSVSVRS